MDNCAQSLASSSSSPASWGTSSPVTTPELSDDGFDIDRPPSPFGGGGSIDGTDWTDGASPTFILVIGGLGYIGSHTVLELLREGYNVCIVDNLGNSFDSVLINIKTLIARHCREKGSSVPLIHFHRLDYRSRSMRFLLDSYSDVVRIKDASGKQRLTYRSRIAGVIHFAAYKSVAESITEPLRYYQNNVCGLVTLLQRLNHYGIHNFIFSSSATVYGAMASAGLPLREDNLLHQPEEIVDEEVAARQPSGPMGLTCPYARSKYFAEAILADTAAANPAWRIVALRYFNPVGCDPSGLLGENPRAEATNLYPVIAQVLTGTRPRLDVFGSDWSTRDGTAVRDFVHVLDVARGHISALAWNAAQKPAKSGIGRFRAFNLGSGSGTTVLEAVQSLEAAAGRSIPLNLTGRRPGDVGFCVASSERAQKELGWFPRESVGQCAKDLWNYLQRERGMA
ncbi:UDP-glucose 4-epimerase [Diplogelasinospora grovesii]|uniref:UDP-glucose 4-epimerase n=1 Tax=Diplogelasinospora grovesii TaxID=303347 RepID=A0AAN6S2Z3_9PEZI|nr:UDP-glucose 4-epimerase [Diplogelasinospora grovesii]